MPITINGSGTLTGISAGGLPDAIITQPELAANVAGNGPAFSAYAGTSQTITANTFTKIQFNVEEFDTNSNYDNVTNYRFTPTVSGYYQVNAQTAATSTVGVSRVLPAIYKNGSDFKRGADTITSAARSNISALIYMNGSTDYIEYFVLINGTGTLSTAISANVDNYFQASLVRAA